MTTQTTIRVRVLSKVKEAEDILCFELADADGAPLPPFSAGSHIDLEIAPGLTRQYSLCNDPSEQHRYQIAVLRDPLSRGGSSAVHESIDVGDIVRISTPRNLFPLVPARRYLLLAGGIGITPILCMAERLARTGADFVMHYCTRSPERMAFRERIHASPFSDRVRLHFDSGPGDRLCLGTELAAALPDTHLYVCGPAGFIDFVTSEAMAHGWSSDRVHREYFGAQQPGVEGDKPFEVRIAGTGQRIMVPSDKTVVQALEEHGIVVPVSCEQGVCGTCITRVLDGVPDHRDQYLTDEEHAANDQFTPCCSRARTAALVIDL